MKRLVLIFLILAGIVPVGYGQVNVELLHQLVSESQSEHSRQDEAKNMQMVTSANEEVNRSKMSKLKTKYRELQSRFSAIGTVVNATQIAIEAIPILDDIVQQQTLIFHLAGQDPLLITLAYQVEDDLVQEAYALTNYIYGLALSMGDLNQMKSSDRKILFNHVITELRRIAGTSRGLANTLYYSGKRKVFQSINPFADFVNEDKHLVDDILNKVNVLKNQ